MFYLWNVLSMKCYIYEMFYLWYCYLWHVFLWNVPTVFRNFSKSVKLKKWRIDFPSFIPGRSFFLDISSVCFPLYISKHWQRKREEGGGVGWRGAQFQSSRSSVKQDALYNRKIFYNRKLCTRTSVTWALYNLELCTTWIYVQQRALYNRELCTIRSSVLLGALYVNRELYN